MIVDKHVLFVYIFYIDVRKVPVFSTPVTDVPYSCVHFHLQYMPIIRFMVLIFMRCAVSATLTASQGILGLYSSISFNVVSLTPGIFVTCSGAREETPQNEKCTNLLHIGACWWPIEGLLSQYPIYKSSHRNLFGQSGTRSSSGLQWLDSDGRVPG